MDPQQTPQYDLRATTPAMPTAPVSTDPRQQIVDRLKGAVNVLVTVSANPSVDQLSAAIGFTLVLNKLKKHGTAVFSGETPSTIEFLKPEMTIEKNTDSLRDFIVALDKSKADKLRYKVEDKFVKIFITPYHTSLTEKDLEFGQGDFNVDVIIALGVGKREELDQAITAHGRILHDATVVSITKTPSDQLGAINWHVPSASSFSEILVGLSDMLKSPQTELFDEQIATAFLTGIVSETDRFSNDKTTPQTMSMASILMKAGANQQLIASKLEEPLSMPEVAEIPQVPMSQPEPPMPAMPTPLPVSPDGSLQITHSEEPSFEPPADDIHIDDEGMLHKLGEEPTGDSLPMVDMNPPQENILQPLGVDHDDQTLEEIEKAVKSPHLSDQPQPPDSSLPVVSETEARQNVDQASEAQSNLSFQPIASLGAMPVDLDMGHNDNDQPAPGPGSLLQANSDPNAPVNDDATPPPVPPPIL